MGDVISVTVQRREDGVLLVSAAFRGGDAGGVILRLPADATAEAIGVAVRTAIEQVESVGDAELAELVAEGGRQDAAERRGAN